MYVASKDQQRSALDVLDNDTSSQKDATVEAM